MAKQLLPQGVRGASRQPKAAPHLNKANPLTRDLVLCAIPIGALFYDVLSRQFTRRPHTLKSGLASDGNRAPAMRGCAPGAADLGNYFTNRTPADDIVGPWTVFAEVSPEADAQPVNIIYATTDPNQGNGFAVFIDDSAIDFNNMGLGNQYQGVGVYAPEAMGADSYQYIHRLAWAWSGTHGKFYSKRKLYSSLAYSTAIGTTGIENRKSYILSTDDGLGGGVSGTSLVLVYNRELSLTEYQMLYDNPWQVFEDDSQSAVSFSDIPVKRLYPVRGNASKQPQIPRLLPNKFSRKLLAAFVPVESGPGLREYVSGVKAVGSFGPAGSNIRYRQPCSIGLGLYLDGSYVTWQAGASRSPFQIAQGFTVCWGGSYQTRDTIGAFFFSMFDASRVSQAACSSNGGAIRMTLGTSVFNFPGVNSDSIYDGKTVHSAVTFNNANTIAKLFINGSKLSEVTTSSNSGDLGTNPYFTLGTGMGLNTGEAFDGTQTYFYIFDGELTPDEILRIRSNPWQLFEDESQSAVSFSDMPPLNRIYKNTSRQLKIPTDSPWIKKGLVALCTPMGEHVANRTMTWDTSAPSVRGGRIGVMPSKEWQFDGSKAFQVPSISFIPIPFTVIFTATVDTGLGDGYQCFLSFQASGSGNGWAITANLYHRLQLTFSFGEYNFGNNTLINGKTCTYVVVAKENPGVGYIFKAFRDGIPLATNTGIFSPVSTSVPLTIGATSNGVSLLNFNVSPVSMAGIFRTALSDHDAYLLSMHPESLFEDGYCFITPPTVSVSVYRPNSDVSITGWTGVPLSNLYDNINEVSSDTADYNLSPALSGTPDPAIHGLEGAPLPAGTYTIGISASTTIGSGYVRVRLYDNSSVEVGASILQPVTISDTTFYLNITTTGDAYRCSVEFTN
jgi:hypothetical protein